MQELEEKGPFLPWDPLSKFLCKSYKGKKTSTQHWATLTASGVAASCCPVLCCPAQSQPPEGHSLHLMPLGNGENSPASGRAEEVVPCSGLSHRPGRGAMSPVIWAARGRSRHLWCAGTGVGRCGGLCSRSVQN